ncbi:ECF-type sigma factor [Ideonella sp. DXS29W]|uniref:ECF-type sigma factor n=1 Tax=Ideonella lacteola TaxID=2984193 RepID=A0ABU9BXB0_9BURK
MSDTSAHDGAEPETEGPEAAPGAALDHAFREIYPQLRRIAHARLRKNRHLTLLDTDALVHECFIRLDFSRAPAFQRPLDALPFLSSVMRAVVVDAVRRRAAERHGGGQKALSLDEAAEAMALAAAHRAEAEILDIDGAVRDLAMVDARLARVVELKFFGGCTEAEIASVLDITERTVRRDWSKARELLRAALRG